MTKSRIVQLGFYRPRFEVQPAGGAPLRSPLSQREATLQKINDELTAKVAELTEQLKRANSEIGDLKGRLAAGNKRRRVVED